METPPTDAARQRRLRWILLNVCVGQFIVGLDQRALLVALPTLTHTFHTSLTTIQWVLLIYDLTLIALVLRSAAWAISSAGGVFTLPDFCSLSSARPSAARRSQRRKLSFFALCKRSAAQ